MNNLELTSVLEVGIFGLAIAQALTILLTIRRERDVGELRELIEEQRLRLVELRAWIAGRNASQTRQIASGHEKRAEAIAPVKPAMPAQEDDQSRTTEDAATLAVKTLEWQRDVAARLQAGIQAAQTQQAEMPVDKLRLRTSDDKFKWFNEDPNEPREIVEAREIVANFNKGSDRQGNGSLESSPRPSTTDDQLEKVSRAVSQLKEDVERSAAITRPNGKPQM